MDHAYLFTTYLLSLSVHMLLRPYNVTLGAKMVWFDFTLLGIIIIFFFIYLLIYQNTLQNTDCVQKQVEDCIVCSVNFLFFSPKTKKGETITVPCLVCLTRKELGSKLKRSHPWTLWGHVLSSPIEQTISNHWPTVIFLVLLLTSSVEVSSCELVVW